MTCLPSGLGEGGEHPPLKTELFTSNPVSREIFLAISLNNSHKERGRGGVGVFRTPRGGGLFSLE